MSSEWLVTPNDGTPPYYLKVPDGEMPSHLPEGHWFCPAPPKPSEEELEAEREAQFFGDGSWNTPHGVVVKNLRNAKIAEATAWATSADVSPLTEESRLEWVAYVQDLQAITVDFAGPGDVIWPEEPVNRYKPRPERKPT